MYILIRTTNWVTENDDVTLSWSLCVRGRNLVRTGSIFVYVENSQWWILNGHFWIFHFTFRIIYFLSIYTPKNIFWIIRENFAKQFHCTSFEAGLMICHDIWRTYNVSCLTLVFMKWHSYTGIFVGTLKNLFLRIFFFDYECTVSLLCLQLNDYLQTLNCCKYFIMLSEILTSVHTKFWQILNQQIVKNKSTAKRSIPSWNEILCGKMHYLGIYM